MDAATKSSRRIHVTMPESLIAEIDARLGQRRRSQFISEAAQEKLDRQRLKAALAEMDGALADVDIPGWETPESASEWVHNLRYHPDRLVPGRTEGDG
jgi:hypothetical protein